MGLFDNNDEASRAARELEERDAEIEDLKRKLAAKTNEKEKVKVKVHTTNEDDPTTDEDEDESAPRSVRSVSIKLPPFSETNPELWFSKAESQFKVKGCLLYTSPSPRDKRQSRMPSSA